MERRRRHLECGPGEKGCLVVIGESCRRKEAAMGWMMGRVVRDEGLFPGCTASSITFNGRLMIYSADIWIVVSALDGCLAGG